MAEEGLKQAGRLRVRALNACSVAAPSDARKMHSPPDALTTHLLVFQMCRVSGSEIPLLSACSSRKSKKYLTARGGLSSRMLRMALNRSSRNFCSVPYRGAGWLPSAQDMCRG